MKKILVLINNSIGLYKFRFDLLKELCKHNRVVVSVPDNGFLDEFKLAGCIVYVTDIDRRGVNPLTDIKLYQKYTNILRQENPDLVITYTIKPNIYGGLACRMKKIPYVINVTGLGTAFQKDNILQRMVSAMCKISFKKAGIVFFENIENKNFLVERKIVDDNRCCVLNGAGVNLEYYSYVNYPISDKTVHFLFVGRVMREKGVDELFGAMRLLRNNGYNCVLDIVGMHEEDYDFELESAKKEGWLRYHGYQEDVRPFIKNAHCFVLPSWHEGMANTNLECAASGRPIITSDIHGCKEAVVENVSGFLCEPQNVESLYDCMKHFLLLAYNQKVKMGVLGRKHMENMFDKRKVVQETIRALDNYVGGIEC